MTWYAGNNSTNGGNNTGWVFTAPPGGGTAYSLTCATGSYAVTGQAATFTYTAGAINYTLTCSVGTYSYTGQSATFKLAKNLICNAGSYAVIGQDATLTYVTNAAIPVSRGGFKGKKKVFKDDRKDVESDVANAIDKVIGIKQPETLIEIKTEKPINEPILDKSKYDAQLQDLVMKAQAIALQAEIDHLIQAELDDEESLMLLL